MIPPIYLCDEHFESLHGNYGEWSYYPVGSRGRCDVCGDEAKYGVSLITLTGSALSRYILLINNERSRGKNIWQNGNWTFDADSEEAIHLCGQCHRVLNIVKPGKYQCETPWCPSNQKEIK